MSGYIDRQIELRQKAWHEAKDLLATAATESRDLTAEEQSKYENIVADVDRRGEVIKSMEADEARESEIRSAMVGHEEARPETREVAPEMDDAAILTRMSKGEIRNYEFRDLSKAASGAPIPTSFLPRIMEVMRWTGPFPNYGEVFTTPNGTNLQIPRTLAYSVGSVTPEGTQFGESDPTFQSFLTLSSFKISTRFDTTSEFVRDSGVDILGYLAKNIGQALGYKFNLALTLGTGVNEPTGVVTSAGSALTSGTSQTFAYNDVVDLYYSLDYAVRNAPQFAFMASTGALKRLRKMVDTTNQPLWQPAVIAGQPDLLLGKPITENPHMADIGAGTLPVIAGDFGSFLIRQVGGLTIETSDDFQFDKDLRTWKAKLFVDSGLPQANHIKYLRCAV